MKYTHTYKNVSNEKYDDIATHATHADTTIFGRFCRRNRNSDHGSI